MVKISWRLWRRGKHAHSHNYNENTILRFKLSNFRFFHVFSRQKELSINQILTLFHQAQMLIRVLKIRNIVLEMGNLETFWVFPTSTSNHLKSNISKPLEVVIQQSSWVKRNRRLNALFGFLKNTNIANAWDRPQCITCYSNLNTGI